MKTDYTIKVGETLRLQLIKESGDFSTVGLVTCKMKKAGPNGSVPSENEPYVATLSTNITIEGWDFILEDEQTALIKPGVYIADAKFSLTSGDVIKTEPVTIRIDPSVT